MHEFESAIDSDGGLLSLLFGDEHNAGRRTLCSSANISAHPSGARPAVRRGIFVADNGQFQLPFVIIGHLGLTAGEQSFHTEVSSFADDVILSTR